MQEQLDFDDIFGLWGIPWWEKPWVWFFLIIGLSGFIVLVTYAVRRYRARALIIDPRVRALQQLALIKPGGPFENQDEYKNFYVTLFFILKEYFDARYNLSCSGKTDRELVFYVCQQYKIAQHQELVQTLIDHSFYVKFAHDISTYERVVADYEMVLGMIMHEPMAQK